jgi:hypothetical protein
MLKSGLEVIKPEKPYEFWCWQKGDFKEDGTLIVGGDVWNAAKRFACVQDWTQHDTPAVVRVLTHEGEVYEVTIKAHTIFTGSDVRQRWPKVVK